MDSEYMILAAVLIFIGVSGIVLFNGPKTPAGDSCYCIIPSPESSAMQGTAGILLIFGVMFVPIGILKGGLPTRGEGPPGVQVMKSGRTYAPEAFSSGAQLGLGILLVVVGLDAVFVPGYLVFHSIIIMAVGAVLALLGLFLAYRGLRVKK